MSVPPSDEVQAEQGKLSFTTAYITFIKVFRNSIKKLLQNHTKILENVPYGFFFVL